jgi:hypothetical protein
MSASANPEESFQGTCFGFAVQSSLPFAYLREGSGAPLHVNELNGAASATPGPVVARWTGGPDNIETRLHSMGDEYRLWLRHVGWFKIDPNLPEIGLPHLPSKAMHPVAREQLMAWREASLWGLPVLLCAMRRGSFPIHAASVDVAGFGLLIGAPGTFGKTTLAAAFLKAGHRMLSDDMACCDLAPSPSVLPGPAVVRLRRDVADWLELPQTRIAFTTEPKIGLAVEPAVRGDGSAVPLRAIVLLHKSDTPPTLARASFSDALRDVFVLSPKAVLDQAGAFADAARIVETVPVWYLDRKLDVASLPDLVDMIVERCIKP